MKPKIWGQSKSLPKQDIYLSNAAEYAHMIDFRQRILGDDLASDSEGKGKNIIKRAINPTVYKK